MRCSCSDEYNNMLSVFNSTIVYGHTFHCADTHFRSGDGSNSEIAESLRSSLSVFVFNATASAPLLVFRLRCCVIRS